MKLKLQQGILIKRYKRFLADVTLNDGTERTMHCANTGAMTGCATPGDKVFFSTSDNPKRKYANSWELTKTQKDDLICINTIRANQLVEEALINKAIPEFTQYSQLKREVKYGDENSKIDFLLEETAKPNTYIEVKSVTLLDGHQGYFPDAVTTRGQKHLRELINIVEQGQKAVLLFAVLHTGIHSVKAAAHIDPEYAKLLIEAQEKGVKILAYKAKIEITSENCELIIDHSIPVNY